MGNLCASQSKKDCNSLPRTKNDSGNNSLPRTSSKMDIDKTDGPDIANDVPVQVNESLDKCDENNRNKHEEKPDRIHKRNSSGRPSITRIRYRRLEITVEPDIIPDLKENDTHYKRLSDSSSSIDEDVVKDENKMEHYPSELVDPIGSLDSKPNESYEECFILPEPPIDPSLTVITSNVNDDYFSYEQTRSINDPIGQVNEQCIPISVLTKDPTSSPKNRNSNNPQNISQQSQADIKHQPNSVINSHKYPISIHSADFNNYLKQISSNVMNEFKEKLESEKSQQTVESSMLDTNNMALENCEFNLRNEPTTTNPSESIIRESRQKNTNRNFSFDSTQTLNGELKKYFENISNKIEEKSKNVILDQRIESEIIQTDDIVEEERFLIEETCSNEPKFQVGNEKENIIQELSNISDSRDNETVNRISLKTSVKHSTSLKQNSYFFSSKNVIPTNQLRTFYENLSDHSLDKADNKIKSHFTQCENNNKSEDIKTNNNNKGCKSNHADLDKRNIKEEKLDEADTNNNNNNIVNTYEKNAIKSRRKSTSLLQQHSNSFFYQYGQPTNQLKNFFEGLTTNAEESAKHKYKPQFNHYYPSNKQNTPKPSEDEINKFSTCVDSQSPKVNSKENIEDKNRYQTENPLKETNIDLKDSPVKSQEFLSNQNSYLKTKTTSSFNYVASSLQKPQYHDGFIKDRVILPACDPKSELFKSPIINVSIKVIDKLQRRKSEDRNRLPWKLDTEEQNLVKRQPYLLKRLNRPTNCLVNNDHADSISNGCANKVVSNDRAAKSISFAATPQYFKLNMIDEVPESEVPNEKSIGQSPIDQNDKYFDQVALNLCEKKIVSFETLIFQLIYENPNIKTDLDKARAVFTWLTNKNATEAHFEYLNERKDYKNDETESPDVYLHGLCTGQYTYAQFFQLLCRFAGIRCKLLRGYAKGNDFKPGMKLEGGKAAQHAWNSVEINGIWYLCDTHWTARRLAGRNSGQGKSGSTKLDMFYFLIHPEDMKYSHFPFEKTWQLLANEITLDTFEKLAIVKPAFFRFELSFYNNFEAIIKTKNDIKLELKFPTNETIERLTFTYTLQMDGKCIDSHKDIPLSRYGLVEIIKIDEKMSLVRFWFRFPESGSYKIMIFAKSIEDQLFSGVCEYYVVVDLDPNQPQATKPFPPTQQTCYGKTELLAKYDIASSWSSDSIIKLDCNIFEIKFQTRKKSENVSCPRLMGRLKCNSIEDNELSKRLLIRIMAPTEENYKADYIATEIVHIRGYVPQNDEYALEIYANNPDTEGSSFFLIWQHLIVCENVLTDQPVPQLSQGFILGAQERFKELGLRALSHPDPLIVIDQQSIDPDVDVCIKLSLPIIKTSTSDHKPPIRILGQLLDASRSNQEEENDYSSLLLQQAYTGENNSLNEVEFLIRLNKKSSFYKLYIYAMSLDKELDTVPLAMTYLIHLDSKVDYDCLKGVKFGEFPQQTSQWKEDCRLMRPLNKVLKLPSLNTEEKAEEHFEVIIPHAMKVASVINDDWVQFVESENQKSKWTGSVHLSHSLKSGTQLTVFANFNSRYNSYIPLLEYVLQR